MTAEDAFDFHFEWDVEKAAVNARKHGVSFPTATEVFRDPLAVTIFDSEHSVSEDLRWITMGRSSRSDVLVVIHTWQDLGPGAARVRITSARNATRQERRAYEEQAG